MLLKNKVEMVYVHNVAHTFVSVSYMVITLEVHVAVGCVFTHTCVMSRTMPNNSI